MKIKRLWTIECAKCGRIEQLDGNMRFSEANVMLFARGWIGHDTVMGIPLCEQCKPATLLVVVNDWDSAYRVDRNKR